MGKFLRRRKVSLKERSLIAYDIETTRIEHGTPTPLYLSTFDGQTVNGYTLSSLSDLHDIVHEVMTTPENVGSRFVGYNANRFDAHFIALAMMTDSRYQCEPWLTRSGSFRGMAIRSTEHKRNVWYFSDSMAMFGYLGNLESFIETFAPNQRKEHIDIMNFDSSNVIHRHYAENDSKALWYATTNAAHALRTVTGLPPQNTIGKTAIKFFESQMPENVHVRDVPYSARKPLLYAKRGGYVYSAGRYKGPTWKYDLNQAYAAAMRMPLPAGRCAFTYQYRPNELGVYLCTIKRNETTKVPFYIRDDKGKPITTDGAEVTGWILSPEIDYLNDTGWNVEVREGWVWDEQFDMSSMVNKLEQARSTCDGGPKGPLGTMYKMVGNHAYGKTLEEHDGLRMVYAVDPPEGYYHYMAEDDTLDHVWFTIEKPRREAYHKPQIGIFITAYVRLWIMRAALLSPNTFIYADTDCVAFCSDMTDRLDIDLTRYGAFKIESNGDSYGFINKKVYYSIEPNADKPTHPKYCYSKGLHPKDVTLSMFDQWYDGILPKQLQTQRQNLIKVAAGESMFLDRNRSGSFVLPYFDSS